MSSVLQNVCIILQKAISNIVFLNKIRHEKTNQELSYHLNPITSIVKDYDNDQYDLYFYGFYDKTILDDNRKIVTIE